MIELIKFAIQLHNDSHPGEFLGCEDHYCTETRNRLISLIGDEMYLARLREAL